MNIDRNYSSFSVFTPDSSNTLADVPIRYGKPPAWRFYKGGFRVEKGQRVNATDLPAIPREELRAAIRKCHQTLWEGGRRSPIAAFGEFCKIIFVKHRDEKNADREDGQPYREHPREARGPDRAVCWK